MLDDAPSTDPSSLPRGFAWPKETWLYHATTGMRRLLDEGFKTREQLGGAHALGGGPDNGISFALDRRVTRSIAVGLNTLRRAARWEIGIGDLILQTERTAPKGLRGLLETIRTTPEDIVRYDQALTRVALGHSTGALYGYFGVESLTEKEWEELAPNIEDAKEHFAGPGATKPYLVEGWAPIGAVIDVKPDANARWKQHNENFAEAYKNLLANASGWKELYNPVFWATSMDALALKEEDDVGIVRCRVNAEWVCADWRSAEDAGLEPEAHLRGPMSASDWSDSCDNHLGDKARARARNEEPRGWYSSPHTVGGTKWDAPDPSDTIAYRGSLTEIRVYDPKMIVDLERYETFDDLRHEIDSSFFNKGIDGIDDPFAYPWFRSYTPRLV